MRPDLHATRLALQDGATDVRAEMATSIEIARSPACEHAFVRPMFEEALAETEGTRGSRGARLDRPLAGLAFSVKDLFDIASQPTPAGSAVLSHSPAALADAAAVARLRTAGGVSIGRTNMTEFAFSGVGVNPHFGTPRNPADDQTIRIPGGSSSGAAVSVATGAAFIGLGSDTGGSIRIPAALTGIVGFKSTARLVPATGALPLSTTLDTVCALTRSVRDAITAHEILADRRVTPGSAPLAAYRLAVPDQLFFDGIEKAVVTAFERSLSVLSAAGARIERISLPLLDEIPTLNATGGFSAPEAYAWHRLLLERSGAGYDPRVAQRILKGATMKAHEYIELVRSRAAWIARFEQALAGYDALLSPTVPITAPTLASVAPGEERDAEFFRINALLLRNPSAINLLDGCAISIPCHSPGELPTGLMIWHAALQDDAVLAVALQAEAALNKAR